MHEEKRARHINMSKRKG